MHLNAHGKSTHTPQAQVYFQSRPCMAMYSRECRLDIGDKFVSVGMATSEPISVLGVEWEGRGEQTSVMTF